MREEAQEELRAEPYTPARLEDWDGFVRSHPFASQGHLSANFALAQSRYAAPNRSLMIYGSDGAVLGVLPLFELRTKALRAIAGRELKSGVEFPGGPLIHAGISPKRQSQVLDVLQTAVRGLAQSRNVDRITIGYPNLVGDELSIAHFGYLPLKEYGFLERNGVYYYLDLQPGEEDLFRNLKDNCRRNIRAARSKGARVRILEDRKEWMGCYGLNLETLSDAQLTWSPEDMAVVWDYFIAPGHASAIAVTLEDRIASVVVFTHVNKGGYYWIGFNHKPYILQGANHYALWEAILCCKAKNIAMFEIGSKSFQGEKLKSISVFKERFGGTPAYALSGSLDLKPVKRHLLALADLGVEHVSRNIRPALARLQRRRDGTAETAMQQNTGLAVGTPSGSQG